MNKTISICCLLFSLVFLSLQDSNAQCYKRISLVGGVSVRIIPKTVVSKPDKVSKFEEPWQQIQFQRNNNTITIHAIEIDQNKNLKGFDNNTPPQLLIEYTKNHYNIIDSTCISFDTLQMGKIEMQYPFADLLQISIFDNPKYSCNLGTSNYSSIQERLFIIDKYLYIFYVHSVNPCFKDIWAKKIPKQIQKDFKRLIRSMKINKDS